MFFTDKVLLQQQHYKMYPKAPILFIYKVNTELF